MIKSFKQFILEQGSDSDINSMLQKYTSGAIEEYDNKGSYMNLFDPNGNGLPKLLSNFNLVILDKDNTIYSGKDTLIKNHLDFNLSLDTETKPYKKLHIELSKTPDGDYIVKLAKVF